MKKTLLTIIAGVVFTFANAQDTLYVSASASGNDDGTSWGDAYLSLNTALGVAGAGDEIWVAEGVYVPGATANSQFTIPSTEVRLYGGFLGTENSRSEKRDPKLTVLSGDANNDGVISVGDCYHIMNAQTPNVNSIIDGFSFTGGNSISSYPQNVGGALIVSNGGITVQNCNFIKNTGNYGGAIYSNSTNMNLINCIFSDNHAISGSGGAIDSENAGNNLQVINCTFYNNTASAQGEAISNFSSTSNSIVNSIFWGNGSTTTLLYSFTASDISNSLVQGGFAGATNIIDADPIFNLTDSIDFSINACSPVIDKGDTTGFAFYNNEYDVSFNNRFIGFIDLGANEFNLNNVVTVSGPTLTSGAIGDSLKYQWINCSNNQALSGKTSKTLNVSTSGNYAVIVITDDSCIVDTSDCKSITIAGSRIDKNENGLSIYPNPTNGQFKIDFTNHMNIKNIEIYNILGEQILETKNSSIDLSTNTNGVYFIRIRLEDDTIISDRIIKK